MAFDVTPDKQNINIVFSNTMYYIDFYQREYKWSEEPVKRLLDDIFFRFLQEYAQNKHLDITKENIIENYSWYYLNTYVTNNINGKVYVVDGQQRLTTLTLILIKLYHVASVFQSGLQGWIEDKIAGKSGYDYEFWMNHEKDNETLNILFKEELPIKEIKPQNSITSKNIIKNYQIISDFLESELDDIHKFETFVFYFMHRLVLINLTVEQTNVPMVFEVINDRGVRLKPYEILKGKLLGQIDKNEMKNENYNELWENKVKTINNIVEDDFDNFFRSYLKAKYADSRKEGQKFDGDYHREMFKNSMNDNLNLKHNPTGVKEFLKNDFSYFTELYRKILKSYQNYHKEFPHVFFNRLNDLDGQFLLIISACNLFDEDEKDKIKTVSYELDRLFSLLRLQSSYESNSFYEIIFKISSELRNQPIDNYRSIFDKYLISEINSRRNVNAQYPLTYSYFKNTGVNLNMRFRRYFFARIEKFLADNMNLNMKHTVNELVSKTGHKTGFHIEHILSYNDENLQLFENNEELFEQERNRLGGILLLKGRDNISSNNESFEDKLKSYANTLYWNETLREDSYKSKLDISELKKKYSLNLEPYSKFGPKELEKRHHLLFQIAQIIWQ